MGADHAEHYGFNERAFEAAPDPRYHFPSLTQRMAISAISQALSHGSGVVSLTGEEGLGKSTLLAHFVDQTAGQPVTVAWLEGGREAAAAYSFASRVAEGFGLARPTDGDHALAAIEAFLLEESRRGQRALLLVDGAEALRQDAADDLAALSELRHGERSLLQIVLAGDQSFARRLAEDDGWAGVCDRIVASHSFEPLMRDEVEPYLRHRLLCAGWEGEPALTPGLAAVLHEAAGGVPAVLNRAMSVLLDEAAETDAKVIDGDALAAWLDREVGETEYEVVANRPEAATADPLTEAQIAAIEQAFADHERKLTRLRRDVTVLRDRSAPTAPVTAELDERLQAIEGRLDQHEQALRQMLERLIAYFERPRGDAR